MSYAVALGATESWGHISSARDDVYLWRASVSPALDASNSRALFDLAQAAARDIVDAYAHAFVLGATIAPDGRTVDVVWRVATGMWPLMHGAGHTTADIAEAVTKSMRNLGYRDFSVTTSDTLMLKGPDQAVQFWQGLPPIWNTGATGLNSLGAQRAQLYRGTADDGNELNALQDQAQPGFGPATDASAQGAWCRALESWRWDAQQNACFARPLPAATPAATQRAVDSANSLACSTRGGQWDAQARACRYGAGGGVMAALSAPILGIPAWGWAAGLVGAWWWLKRKPAAAFSANARRGRFPRRRPMRLERYGDYFALLPGVVGTPTFETALARRRAAVLRKARAKMGKRAP